MMDGIDLFKEYIVDRERKHLHYDDEKRGFITYSFPENIPNQVFIDDMFVVDSKRELKVVMGMIRFVEREAQALGKTVMVGAVNIRRPDCERILMSHFWHGMKLAMTSGDFIYTQKEL